MALYRPQPHPLLSARGPNSPYISIDTDQTLLLLKICPFKVVSSPLLFGPVLYRLFVAVLSTSRGTTARVHPTIRAKAVQ